MCVAAQPQEPPPLGKMLAAGAAVVAFGIVLSLLLSGFDFSSIPRQVAQVGLAQLTAFSCGSLL